MEIDNYDGLLPYSVPGGITTSYVNQTLTINGIPAGVVQRYYFCYAYDPKTFASVADATLSIAVYVDGQPAAGMTRSLQQLMDNATVLLKGEASQISLQIGDSAEQINQLTVTYSISSFTLAQSDFPFNVYLGFNQPDINGMFKVQLSKISTSV